ncbi:M13 family metallopeptidase [Parafilimonas terrae]|uniref:Putative endopeptidase n=1 Tax=Parafilimonas terrae TaxID=1465490 RepID=A0A1I5XR04_9BACT|nr:M13 family metallopeptidase [Parafilimonas terrae]SFQ34373.1 putative endopeptidase [Parafilimonas terrae]
MMNKLLYAASFLIIFSACNTNKEYIAGKFIETGYMDSAVKPGDNFFQFINGKWIDTVHIPETESGIGAFDDLYYGTRDRLHALLNSVSKTEQKAGSIEQKVADFYASGMDSAAIEQRGYDPVKPYLQQIDSIKDATGIMAFVNKLEMENSNPLYGQGVSPDEKNSAVNIAIYTQAGIGLPDRDYYFKTDSSTAKVVAAYKNYMKQLFMLTGSDSSKAAIEVAQVYELEKQLASSHKTNVQLRDPQTNYHKMAVADLDKQMPVFAWKNTLSTIGVHADSVNVSQPEYYIKLNQLLQSIPVDVWKSYFKFHVLNDAASALSSDFVNAKFEYAGKALSGQQKLRPRWQRMVVNTDNTLGDALGQLYVKKYFTGDAKQRMLDMVNNLQKAFAKRIDNLDWMSDSTKAVAKDKLNAFLKKIGYTDKWRDYSKVTITSDKYFENLLSCAKNEYQYQVDKIGKPVDKTEWEMSPPTINAYYNPTFNEIVFPAGILQFPFFDPNADDAINYGGIGMVIGHEMTHGFDDEGAQYDKDGNLKNWWSKEDSAKFVAKSKQVIDLYNSYVIIDSIHVNGALTTGENMADIGGVAIAYDAFKMTKQGQDTTRIDGFTPDQRFFISIGQVWREKLKPETMRFYANVDPHSPAMFRVNGPLANFGPFYKAFNVQPGDKMFIPEDKRIKIW